MSLPDTNSIIRAYLAANAALVAVVSDNIFVGPLPENTVLPAVSFFTRGGLANPHIPDLPNPSKQIDCWGGSPIIARQVYRLVYDALQNIEEATAVSMPDGSTKYVLSAVEEVQGQDLMDPDVPDYYRVMTFFSIIAR